MATHILLPGHVIHVSPDIPQNWMHDLLGAAPALQAEYGVQPQQMQEIVEEMAPNVVNNDLPVNDNEMDVGNEQANADEGAQDVDNHVAQQEISFDQSSSTAQYLRANGPDVHLTVEMVLQGQVGSMSSNSSDSSSFSSVNSAQNDEMTVVSPASFTSQPCHVLFPNLQYPSFQAVNAIPLPISLKRKWNVAFQYLKLKAPQDVAATPKP